MYDEREFTEWTRTTHILVALRNMNITDANDLVQFEDLFPFMDEFEEQPVEEPKFDDAYYEAMRKELRI